MSLGSHRLKIRQEDGTQLLSLQICPDAHVVAPQGVRQEPARHLWPAPHRVPHAPQ
jgi:hypothetical protein